MVTIDPNKPVLGTPDPKRAERPVGEQRGTFNAIFKATVAEANSTPAATDISAGVSGVRPLQFSAQPSPTREMVVDQVEALLDTMATYQQKLIDESATLKTIAPLVERMERQMKHLGKIADAAEGQGTLKPILEQSLAVSAMEIARFKNGQYIG